MYMPHLVHFMLSVGSRESDNMPVKAGMRENIITATVALSLFLNSDCTAVTYIEGSDFYE
jgi:hypothetical protein